jgi:hypothetical protein
VGEKVTFQPFFSNIGEKPAFQKADFSATFANVQGSRLRTLVKKYFFQKDDFQSSMFKDPAIGLW